MSVVTGDVHTRLPALLSFVFSSHWFIRELNQSGFGFGFSVMKTHY